MLFGFTVRQFKGGGGNMRCEQYVSCMCLQSKFLKLLTENLHRSEGLELDKAICCSQ